MRSIETQERGEERGKERGREKAEGKGEKGERGEGRRSYEKKRGIPRRLAAISSACRVTAESESSQGEEEEED